MIYYFVIAKKRFNITFVMSIIATKSFKSMQKEERSLKVYSHHRSSDNKQVPELSLIGCWMDQLVFKAGDRVNPLYSASVFHFCGTR